MGRPVRRSIQLEDAHWPLLLVRFDGTPTDEEFERYLDQMTTMLALRQRHAIVLDATTAHFTPMSQSRMQAHWIRAHKTELEELTAGTAIVFSSRLFRVVVASVFMIQPPPTPYATFGTLAETTHWAAAQLGIAPPETGLVWEPGDTTKPQLKVKP